MMTRTGPHETSMSLRYPSSRSRFSLSTDRLITRQVTSMSRTCSTAISQRDVSHAHGHAGSNHIRTSALAAVEPLRRVVVLPVCAAVVVMIGILSPWPEGSSGVPELLRRESMNGGSGLIRLPVPGQNLTREEAATRADLIAVHSYDVVLDLATGPATFATRSTVRFTAAEGSETFIDFVGESVGSVVLNGTALDS